MGSDFVLSAIALSSAICSRGNSLSPGPSPPSTAGIGFATPVGILIAIPTHLRISRAACCSTRRVCCSAGGDTGGSCCDPEYSAFSKRAGARLRVIETERVFYARDDRLRLIRRSQMIFARASAVFDVNRLLDFADSINISRGPRYAPPGVRQRRAAATMQQKVVHNVICIRASASDKFALSVPSAELRL